MKLLAKAAEDRYQTAAGLKSDLERSLAEWEAQGRIDDFVLAQTDTPDRLLIPERLYGREHEIEALLTSFDRVTRSGTPELILVSGPSGIGKSAFVDEMQRPWSRWEASSPPASSISTSAICLTRRSRMRFKALSEASSPRAMPIWHPGVAHCTKRWAISVS